MVPNVGKNRLMIKNCKKITIKLNLKNIGPPIKQMVHSNKIIKFPTKCNSTIFFKPRGNGLPTNLDFIFIPKKIDQLKNNAGVLSYIINVYILWV